MPGNEPFFWPVSVVMVMTVSTGRDTKNIPSLTCRHTHIQPLYIVKVCVCVCCTVTGSA